MTVVGELVEAQVGLHDQAVTGFRHGDASGNVEDAVLVGRTRAERILRLRDTKQHDAPDARIGGILNRTAQTVERVLDDARHRGDRHRIAEPFAHEHREDEIGGVQARLGGKGTQRGARPKSPGARSGKRHGVVSPSVDGFGRPRGAKSAAPSASNSSATRPATSNAGAPGAGAVAVNALERDRVRTGDRLTSVRSVHPRGQEQQPVVDDRPSADRRRTAGLEQTQHLALAVDHRVRVTIVEGSDQVLLAPGSRAPAHLDRVQQASHRGSGTR